MTKFVYLEPTERKNRKVARIVYTHIHTFTASGNPFADSAACARADGKYSFSMRLIKGSKRVYICIVGEQGLLFADSRLRGKWLSLITIRAFASWEKF